jgi:hypothetical protein
MSGWFDCNSKGFTADRRQEREDTSFVIGQRLLFNEDLLTNATVVDDAIRFISEHNNIKNEKVAKIDNDSELLHNAAANADAVTTTNKVF